MHARDKHRKLRRLSLQRCAASVCECWRQAAHSRHKAFRARLRRRTVLVETGWHAWRTAQTNARLRTDQACQCRAFRRSTLLRRAYVSWAGGPSATPQHADEAMGAAPAADVEQRLEARTDHAAAASGVHVGGGGRLPAAPRRHGVHTSARTHPSLQEAERELHTPSLRTAVHRVVAGHRRRSCRQHLDALVSAWSRARLMQLVFSRWHAMCRKRSRQCAAACQLQNTAMRAWRQHVRVAVRAR